MRVDAHNIARPRGPQPLAEEDRAWLRALADELGEERAADLAGVARLTVVRGIAGRGMYGSTRVAIGVARLAYEAREARTR